MRVGVLTYHNAINYGGVLQAYALQQYLNQIEGISAEVIDYRSEAVEQQYKWLSFRNSSLKAYVLLNSTTVVRRKKKERFNAFVQKEIQLSPQVENVTADALQRYDVIIVGSDQVWNASCTKGDKTYLLDIEGLSIKRISYAASIGSKGNLEKFQNQYHVDFKKDLSEFSDVSLREEDAAEYIENLTGKKCSVVVDPVLLFGRKNWLKLIGQDRKEKNYILVYNIGNFPLTFQFANALSKKTGLAIKVINKDIKGDAKFAGKRNCSNASPKEFVSLIADASYVVTDSFHATAFSLMFHRKFFTIANPHSDNTNSRLLNILNNYGLEQRYITKEKIPNDYEDEIQYDIVDKKMENEREESRNWLLNALEYGRIK